MKRVCIVALAACGRLHFDETGQPLGTCEGFVSVPELPGRYFAEPVEQTWTNSRIGCFERGGDLAFPTTGTEALTMTTLVSNAGGLAPWIGVTDLETEGSYVNLDGEPQTFLPWNPIEPNGSTQENCVRLNAQGEFIDDDCFDTNSSICVC